MTRISLQEQYENKDVIQQIYILKDMADQATSDASDAVADAQQALDNANNALTGVQGSVKSGSVVTDDVSAKLRLVKVSGESVDSVIPIASASQTGMMNSQTFKGIVELGNRVTALENKATTVYVTFPSDSPSQGEITSAFTSAAGRAPAAGDYATDISRGLTYGYDGSTWIRSGGSTVPAFTNTEAGLIKGNTADGTVFAEADGTGSVNGWDELKQSVTENTSEIEALKAVGWKELDVNSLPTDFQVGDVLMAFLKCYVSSASTPSSWSTAPTTDNVTIKTADEEAHPAIFSIGTTESFCNTVFDKNGRTGGIIVDTVSSASGVDGWNSSDSETTLLTLNFEMFNGGGRAAKSLDLTKSLLPTCVARILRLRPN